MPLTICDNVDALAPGLEKVERWSKQGRPTGLAAFESGSRSFGPRTAFPARVKALFGALVISNFAFNLTDLGTTFVALRNGLSEGNSLLLGMSGALGLNVFASLVILKAIFVASAAAVAYVGARSASKTARNMALSYLLTSTLIFCAVSLNNFAWIVS